MNQKSLFSLHETSTSEDDDGEMASKTLSRVNWESATLVFFDTETTGLGPEARLCQLAYKINGVEHESLFKPPVAIEPGASAITGITDEMVQSKEVFCGSQTAKDLTLLASREDVYFVAHNAAFDIDMLSREGISIERYFDTLRLARVIDDGKAENYKQEYLWNYYSLKVADAKAHDALGDVRVLEALFEKLSQLVREDEKHTHDVRAKLWKIMEEPIIFKKMTFGKYRGRNLSDIAQEDPGYLEWLLSQKKTGEKFGDDRDWIVTLEHYLGKDQS
jgi:exodeoxyribonuclease X